MNRNTNKQFNILYTFLSSLFLGALLVFLFIPQAAKAALTYTDYTGGYLTSFASTTGQSALIIDDTMTGGDLTSVLLWLANSEWPGGGCYYEHGDFAHTLMAYNSAGTKLATSTNTISQSSLSCDSFTPVVLHFPAGTPVSQVKYLMFDGGTFAQYLLVDGHDLTSNATSISSPYSPQYQLYPKIVVSDTYLYFNADTPLSPFSMSILYPGQDAIRYTTQSGVDVYELSPGTFTPTASYSLPEYYAGILNKDSSYYTLEVLQYEPINLATTTGHWIANLKYADVQNNQPFQLYQVDYDLQLPPIVATTTDTNAYIFVVYENDQPNSTSTDGKIVYTKQINIWGNNDSSWQPNGDTFIDYNDPSTPANVTKTIDTSRDYSATEGVFKRYLKDRLPFAYFFQIADIMSLFNRDGDEELADVTLVLPIISTTTIITSSTPYMFISSSQWSLIKNILRAFLWLGVVLYVYRILKYLP